MKQYSPFFETLYDQPEPVGVLGRGTHYSVLRIPCWHHPDLTSRSTAFDQDFAVLWDEDHDERVIPVIEGLYRAGLLAPLRYIAERKGGLFVLLDSDAAVALQSRGQLTLYRDRLEGAIKPERDYWELMGFGVVGAQLERIVDDTDERVQCYLSAINMLWNLGHKPGVVRKPVPSAHCQE
jgi:hypothetical protein